MMKQLARLKFTSFNLKVPTDWQTPSGDPAGKHYGDAFKPEEKTVAPGMPPLVQPATMNKYHVDTQKMHIAKIGAFLDGCCDAICGAWGQWQTAATMVGVMITGPVASMGQVVGIPWTPLILASAPKASANEIKYSSAVANVLGTAWLSYTATIKIPGLPWYPAFAAFPSPVAPPMPNIPTPVIALTQVTASLSPAILKQQMVGMLGDPMAPFHGQLFEAICDAFDKCFTIWQASTQVMNVLGTGPIPTFAPPYVPVGPVVGGVGTMAPGGFV
ncbi:MAG: hypothetical protein H0T79_15045 [Deltaproteobacteria bacterium]|nr:hypothetical protein [Deltaproteobacteria bacterium]